MTWFDEVDSDGDGSGKSLQMSYVDIAKTIVRDEGWQGLFGRGLQVSLTSTHTYMYTYSIFIQKLLSRNIEQHT